MTPEFRSSNALVPRFHGSDPYHENPNIQSTVPDLQGSGVGTQSSRMFFQGCTVTAQGSKVARFQDFKPPGFQGSRKVQEFQVQGFCSVPFRAPLPDPEIETQLSLLGISLQCSRTSPTTFDEVTLPQDLPINLDLDLDSVQFIIKNVLFFKKRTDFK
jgi:hypothetical protein